jgi:hypothetical protein
MKANREGASPVKNQAKRPDKIGIKDIIGSTSESSPILIDLIKTSSMVTSSTPAIKI